MKADFLSILSQREFDKTEASPITKGYYQLGSCQNAYIVVPA